VVPEKWSDQRRAAPKRDAILGIPNNVLNGMISELAGDLSTSKVHLVISGGPVF